MGVVIQRSAAFTGRGEANAVEVYILYVPKVKGIVTTVTVQGDACIATVGMPGGQVRGAVCRAGGVYIFTTVVVITVHGLVVLIGKPSDSPVDR